MSYFPSACYNCGEVGHYAASCPEKDTKAHTPRPHTVISPVPPPRPANEIADAHVWAARIRKDLGWTDTPTE